METSPLASLQPNIPGPFSRRCLPNDFSSDFLKPDYNEPNNFNFRDLSMPQPNADYFSWNPIRGSSPTASLAVDLSQNFHIDRSPALPTPRRALFTNNGSSALKIGRVPTPPIPSSSPGPDPSAMDISPLPHKPAFAQARADCPKADYNSACEDSQLPSSGPSMPKAEVPNSGRPSLGHLRRTSNPTRPSLKKGHSVSALGSRARGFSNSTFIFGGPKPPSKPLLEAFAESPPSERKPQHSNSASSLLGGMSPPKFSLTQDGSPIGGMRRASGPKASGPRMGLGRRTQSLQCNDAFRPSRQEKRFCVEGNLRSSSFDLTESDYELKLPHFKHEEEVDGLPRISKDTLVGVLKGDYKHEVPSSTVIDCRFEYEFHGGHIDGALNFNDKEELAKRLFDSQELANSRALIFHCEHSAHRAPLMAQFVRQRDRAVNQERYPNLTFPEVYILDGGYRTFFQSHQDLCFPQSYVEMDSKEHAHDCERGLAKVKRRNKLSRAQTYAFGQNSFTRCDVSVPPVPSLSSAPLIGFSSMDAMDLDSVEEVAFESPAQRAPASGFNRLPRRLETY